MAFLPLRNDLTFSLWPFGQKNLMPIALPMSCLAGSGATICGSRGFESHAVARQPARAATWPPHRPAVAGSAVAAGDIDSSLGALRRPHERAGDCGRVRTGSKKRHLPASASLYLVRGGWEVEWGRPGRDPARAGFRPPRRPGTAYPLRRLPPSRRQTKVNIQGAIRPSRGFGCGISAAEASLGSLRCWCEFALRRLRSVPRWAVAVTAARARVDGVADRQSSLPLVLTARA